MKEEKALVLASLEIEPNEAKERLKKIHEFQAVVRNQLKEHHDYGVVPGTGKPALLKPGAEKIAKLLGLADDYQILEKIEDWEKGFFYYLVKCNLISLQSGVIVSSGLGSCNSKESKYRYRWLLESQLPKDVNPESLYFKLVESKKTGKKYKLYRIENDDPFSLVNTILKMAKKRALVDAALSAGRLSDLFTQDLEDIENVEEIIPEEPERIEEENNKKENFHKTKTPPPIGYEALRKLQELKKKDEELYYETLKLFGYEHATDIPSIEMAREVWSIFQKRYKEKKGGKNEEATHGI